MVCFDEAGKELRGHVAEPLPPGSPARQGYGRARRGAANPFVAVEPLAGRRTTADFAAQVKHVCDVLCPDASAIRAGACSRRLRNRPGFHFAPKRPSWLDMAECGPSVLAGQCLDRRIDGRKMSTAEVAARNAAEAKIDWVSRVADARRKLDHLYPQQLVR